MRKTVKDWALLIAIALTTVVTLATGALPDDYLNWIVIKTPYYFLNILVMLWIFSLQNILPIARGHCSSRQIAEYLGVGLTVAGVVFVAIPPTFRVLADETNLLGVSLSLFSDHTTSNVVESIYYYSQQHSITTVTEKRPFLFPLLIYFIHAVSGYRANNIFVVNFILFTLLIAATYGWFSRFGRIAACAAVLLVIAQPIVPLCATSGGFELLQLVVILLCAAAINLHLTNRSHQTQLFLVTSLLLLAHVRYECFLYVILTLAILMALRLISVNEIRPRWLYLTFPLFFLPLVAQRIKMRGAFQEPAGSPILSLAYFVEHNIKFIKSLADLSFLPFSAIINLTALFILGIYLFRLYRTWPEVSPNRRAWVFIVSGNIVLSWVVINAHYLGVLDHPTAARFFLHFAYFASTLCAFALVIYHGKITRFFSGYDIRMVPLLIAVPIFLFHWRITQRNSFLWSLGVAREYSFFVREVIPRAQSENTLVIGNYPQFAGLHLLGGLSFTYIRSNLATFEAQLNNRLFPSILVVQRMSNQNHEPLPDSRLPRKARLTTIVERQEGPDMYLRLSRFGGFEQ